MSDLSSSWRTSVPELVSSSGSESSDSDEEYTEDRSTKVFTEDNGLDTEFEHLLDLFHDPDLDLFHNRNLILKEHMKQTQDEEETGADTNVQEMEEESSDESESEDEEREAAKKATSTIRAPVMSAPPVQPPPIQAPTPGNVVVRKYDPKAIATVKKREEDQFLVSPITGERIPANKVAEHMKVGLLDPRWVEERDKHITAKATEDVVFAPGQAIEASLKGLAERRTDIFGVGEEAAQETHIGQKMGEEDVMREKMDKVTWDGHSSSAEAAARAARANISLDDQIAEIHRQKGLIPEPETKTKTVVVVPPQMPQQSQPMMHPVVVGVPVRPAMMVPPPMQQKMQRQQQMQQQQQQREQQHRDQQQQQQRQQAQDEPPTKRQRTEDKLIPEGEFMARNLSPVSFKVTVPVMEDKAEWSCSGQTLTLSLHLHDTVASIKTRIQEEVSIKLHLFELIKLHSLLKLLYIKLGGHAAREAESPAQEHLLQGCQHSSLLQRHSRHSHQSLSHGEGGGRMKGKVFCIHLY